MIFETERESILNSSMNTTDRRLSLAPKEPPYSLDELMEGALSDVGAFLLKCLVMTQFFYKNAIDVNSEVFKSKILEKLTQILFL